jgi:hypothetical protein
VDRTADHELGGGTALSQRLDIVKEILSERGRQDRLLEDGTIPWNCADPAVPDGEKLAVLLEEVGEVAKAHLEDTNLREELVHVAAVCVQWIEGL